MPVAWYFVKGNQHNVHIGVCKLSQNLFVSYYEGLNGNFLIMNILLADYTSLQKVLAKHVLLRNCMQVNVVPLAASIAYGDIKQLAGLEVYRSVRKEACHESLKTTDSLP